MKHYLLFLSVAMFLFLSACRSAHSVSKVAEAAQMTEHIQSSAASETTLTNFISAISLQADSLIMFVLPELSCRKPVFQGLTDSTNVEQSDNSGLIQKNDDCITAKPINAIKLYGLNLNSSTAGESKSSLLTKDSVSSKTKQNVTTEEKENSETSTFSRVHYFIYGAIAAAVAIAITLIIRKMKKKTTSS